MTDTTSPTMIRYVKNSSWFDSHPYVHADIEAALKGAGAIIHPQENQWGWPNLPKVVVFSGINDRQADAALSAIGIKWPICPFRAIHWDSPPRLGSRIDQDEAEASTPQEDHQPDPDEQDEAYWQRMRSEGLWVDGQGWTDKAFPH